MVIQSIPFDGPTSAHSTEERKTLDLQLSPDQCVAEHPDVIHHKAHGWKVEHSSGYNSQEGMRFTVQLVNTRRDAPDAD